MTLEHNHPNCAGRWKQEVTGCGLVWRCESCHAATAHTADVEEAAILENQLGRRLAALADSGDKLIEEEREERGE